MAVALLGCGLLGCAAESGPAQTRQALTTTDASVPIALETLETPEGLAEATSPDWRIRLDSKLVVGCTGSELCGAGEQCCPLSGECVPANCDDCCVTAELPNGPMEDPEVDDPSARLR